MRRLPAFSIITPCYNSEKTIERTIRSVIEQTYDNFEYFIIDGGSKDKTVSIIERYKDQYPDKIHYISEPDRGIYDGINKGIRWALEGEDSRLIGIVNSDDYYEKDALKIIADAYLELTENKYCILYGAIRVLKNGQEKSIWINHHSFLPDTMIGHPACFVSKELYQEKGLYSLEFRSAADYEFMLRMFKDPTVLFHPVYNIISNFATGGFSDSKLGDHETKKIKYRFGFMSRKQYFIHLLSYYGRFWRK